MRMSDWSSDVCSSDLQARFDAGAGQRQLHRQRPVDRLGDEAAVEAAGHRDVALDARLQAEADELWGAAADEAHRLHRKIEADLLTRPQFAGREYFLEGDDRVVRLLAADPGVDQQGHQGVALDRKSTRLNSST